MKNTLSFLTNTLIFSSGLFAHNRNQIDEKTIGLIRKLDWEHGKLLYLHPRKSRNR